MSGMMIFLGIAAGATVVVGLASWGYLSWEHYREQQRYAKRTQPRRTTAQRHWSEGEGRTGSR